MDYPLVQVVRESRHLANEALFGPARAAQRINQMDDFHQGEPFRVVVHSPEGQANSDRVAIRGQGIVAQRVGSLSSRQTCVLFRSGPCGPGRSATLRVA